MLRLHIGRSAPKGFVETGKGIHLGRGLWVLRIKPLSEATETEKVLSQIRWKLRRRTK